MWIDSTWHGIDQYNYFGENEVTESEEGNLSTKQVSLNSRVSKGINLPPCTRGLVELVFDEAVAESGLINHIYVVSSCFIMHGPTTISIPQ